LDLTHDFRWEGSFGLVSEEFGIFDQKTAAGGRFQHSMLDSCGVQNRLHQYQPLRVGGILFRFTPHSSEPDKT